MKTINCLGCGAVLQAEDKEKSGYLPKKHLDVALEKDVYCMRCFQMKHYNKIYTTTFEQKAITIIAKKKALVVYVVDVFDLNNTLIDDITSYIGNNKVIVAVNKIDLLPKSTNYRRLSLWLSTQLGVKDIVLISSAKQLFLDQLLKKIDLNRKKQDVYLVGCSNVGKSTLINALIKKYTAVTKNLITVSKRLGTTIDFIEIPFFEDGAKLIDTPGLINNNPLYHLSLSSLVQVIPSRVIKPKVYQLTARQTLIIGGLIVFSFLEGENTSFICYFSEKLKIHRTKTQNAENVFSKHLGTLFTPPTIDETCTYQTHELAINGDDKYDIVIHGIGFITCISQAKITIKTLDGIKIDVRKAII